MADASEDPDAAERADSSDGVEPSDDVTASSPATASERSGAGGGTDPDGESVAELRRRVEEEYDFDDFGPADMARMSAEEWEVAFDPETWITGEELLDRVEADLKQRVADRDVFARIERDDDRVVAYSDSGYATVRADGSVEGQGTVLRDVKPTVALCSMESYDVPEDPPEDLLPEPREVPEGTGELGNTVLQAIAGVQVLAGVVLVGAWLLISLHVIPAPGGTVRSLNVVAMVVAGLLFVAVGVLLFGVVANARLSDKFRAEEYRDRLRAVDLEAGERPEFLPEGDGAERSNELETERSGGNHGDVGGSENGVDGTESGVGGTERSDGGSDADASTDARRSDGSSAGAPGAE